MLLEVQLWWRSEKKSRGMIIFRLLIFSFARSLGTAFISHLAVEWGSFGGRLFCFHVLSPFLRAPLFFFERLIVPVWFIGRLFVVSGRTRMEGEFPLASN